MKKHLSVFELAARGAVYKTLAVGLAAAAAIFALLLAGLNDVENLADCLLYTSPLTGKLYYAYNTVKETVLLD